MNKFDYRKICLDLLFSLKEREKEVLSRRFGLGNGDKETLEAIGHDFGLSRERIRQIESVSLRKVKSGVKNCNKVFEYFERYLERFGGLRREEDLLEELGGNQEQNEIYFLLNLDDSLRRINENNNFYALWMIHEETLNQAEEAVRTVSEQLKKYKEPSSLDQIKAPASVDKKVLASYLDASKNIQQSKAGRYGFASWPEINPKGIKDKAYIALKSASKPLHFTEVAEMIDGGHVQTVHNELIKDNRFVLVGRGIYALSEWGYYPGQVKDVIEKVLKESEQPLDRKEIVSKVLQQRIIKKNTILLNLSNSESFKKDSDGKYTIKEV